MEEMIKNEDIRKLKQYSWIYTILLIIVFVSAVPLFLSFVAGRNWNLDLYLRK